MYLHICLSSALLQTIFKQFVSNRFNNNILYHNTFLAALLYFSLHLIVNFNTLLTSLYFLFTLFLTMEYIINMQQQFVSNVLGVYRFFGTA